MFIPVFTQRVPDLACMYVCIFFTITANECSMIVTGARRDADNNFLWHLGPNKTQSLSYTKWFHGEPANVNEKCLVLHRDTAYTWHDIDCNELTQACFVCECDVN